MCSFRIPSCCVSSISVPSSSTPSTFVSWKGRFITSLPHAPFSLLSRYRSIRAYVGLYALRVVDAAIAQNPVSSEEGLPRERKSSLLRREGTARDRKNYSTLHTNVLLMLPPRVCEAVGVTTEGCGIGRLLLRRSEANNFRPAARSKSIPK